MAPPFTTPMAPIGDGSRGAAPARDRAALDRFARRGVSLPDWVLDEVEQVGGALPERGVTVAVGHLPGEHAAGEYLRSLGARRPAWSALTIDASGVARPPGRDGTAVVADLAALPVRASSADLVIVGNVVRPAARAASAGAELARVCRADGIVAIVMDGDGHHAALGDLVRRAAGSASWQLGSPGTEAVRELVDPYLCVEHTAVVHDEIVVEAVGPVLSYVQGMRSLIEPRLRGFTNWTTVLARARADLDDALARDGVWASQLQTVVLVCRPR